MKEEQYGKQILKEISDKFPHFTELDLAIIYEAMMAMGMAAIMDSSIENECCAYKKYKYID